jgi:uncharacterized protein YaiI (UPF0178 family)
MLEVYVDADGCPVKDEVLRVAHRYGLTTTFVANTGLSLPRREDVRLVVVGQASDAADDWIAERVEPDDLVVTTDIPLAARCLAQGAHVLEPRGRELTADSIGGILASRDLMADLRGAGMTTGGPPPFAPKDRSAFLQHLDRIIQRIRRRRARS